MHSHNETNNSTCHLNLSSKFLSDPANFPDLSLSDYVLFSGDLSTVEWVIDAVDDAYRWGKFNLSNRTCIENFFNYFFVMGADTFELYLYTSKWSQVKLLFLVANVKQLHLYALY